jgi:ribose-phosphate pyrophosphokinase
MSAQSSSRHGHHHSRSEDEDYDPPPNMLASFLSQASSVRRDRDEQGPLGGSMDAGASSEEEEEDLKNPELETTITLVGNVKDRPVFIVDDMIDKSGSWIAAAECCVKRGGATKVYCMATHGLLGDDALQEMEECDCIEKIVVTNSFPIPEEKMRGISKLVTLDVSALLAEAIRRNHHGENISQLYFHHD